MHLVSLLNGIQLCIHKEIRMDYQLVLKNALLIHL